MAVAIMISTFGCNGLILAGAGLLRDGVTGSFPLGTTNRFHVPAVALVAQGIWLTLVLPRTVTMPKAQRHPSGNVYTQLPNIVLGRTCFRCRCWLSSC
jgi:APA family basic amino acid/polyamine antiporter